MEDVTTTTKGLIWRKKDKSLEAETWESVAEDGLTISMGENYGENIHTFWISPAQALRLAEFIKEGGPEPR